MPHLAAIPGLPELWELTRGEPAVRVALIDGPADLEHPCFEGAAIEVVAPSWLPERVAAEPRAQAMRYEHGTWVASVLFGRHGSEIGGLAPDCTGLMIPSLRGEATDHDPVNTARAIESAVEAGAQVAVIELCLPSRSGDVDGLVKRALSAAAQAGVLVVASTGNERGESTCFPAASPDVLAVGAYDDDGRVFGFSNWGSPYDGHGLVAPGGNMTGATPGGGTDVHKGTSCSAPVAAGVAALLLSLQAKHGLAPDPAGVRDALLRTAAPCSARDTNGEPRRCIAGRLDVAAATDLVLTQLRRAARRGGAGTAAGGGIRPSSAAADGPVAGALVFVLGTLGYDFGTKARRDAFARNMAASPSGYVDTSDELAMSKHLTKHPSDVMSLTWTLLVDREPVYAVAPLGPFAFEVHAALMSLLGAQAATAVERVSLPGRLTGAEAELMTGEVVPVVELTARRGLNGLGVAPVAAAASARLEGPAPDDDALTRGVREFLSRVYNMPNAGLTPAQRALNFSATNAFQPAGSIATALAEGRVLDSIDTGRSVACRPDAECWDVRLSFFDPADTRRARSVARFSFDVGDVVPVTLGEVHDWPEPPPPPGPPAPPAVDYGLTM